MGSPFSCLLLVSVFLCFFVHTCLSDPRATLVAMICTNSTAAAPDKQTFVANFVAAMDNMTPQISSRQYGSVQNGTGNNTVYAMGQCMKDLSSSDCNLCFAQCKIQILRCFPFQMGTRGGRVFFDGCYLRYDEYNFFNESLSTVDSKVCASERFSGNTTGFEDSVVELGRNLSSEAPKNGGFFVGSVARGNESVYGLAQCWQSVSQSDCASCLNNSVSRINSCPPMSEGRAINAGCYMRYSTEKFYYNNTAAAATGGTGRSLATILALVFSAIALASIIAIAAAVLRMKLKQKRRERRLLGRLVDTVNKSKLNFSYETLEKATNYFNPSTKLGQGGSGSVYKGILPDGKAVAIKRLVFNTRQWVEHFFNEVNLISDIQHKNLVKLLGCSITGPESLLVYEYVPNLSLHDHLFMKRNVEPLNWEMRCKIILGTAEGLAYLHEESRLRIIHRDIKLSNVLLDEDFTPKIADFGLARLFPEDRTHLSTAVAGTLGYMAPEYVVRGKLTEKADVYSYGVLVIEVVTGRRNNSFTQNALSILQMVWELYGRGRLCDGADPALDGRFQEEEVCRTLHVALLCVQASAELRPSMSTVVKMLTDKFKIPSPTQPPFMNSGRFERSQPLPVIVDNIQPESDTQSSANTMTQSEVFPR